MFTLIPILVIFVFFFVFGTILVHGIKGAKQWRRNNASPVLTVQAQVVTKRADTSYPVSYTHLDPQSIVLPSITISIPFPLISL